MNWLIQFIRSFKITYVIANFFNRKKLIHNKELYKKYELNKSIYSSISGRDFKDKQPQPPWLDTPEGVKELKEGEALQSFEPEVREKIQKWPEEGYIILKGFIDSAKVELINQEIDRLQHEGIVGFKSGGNRMMFALNYSELIKEVTSDVRLMKILKFILRKEVYPFQTINFKYGSDQLAHSDAIHMTTFPLGYLLAVWIALEPTNKENGPLHYYPGSHMMPYILNNDFNNNGSFLRLGKNGYHSYEKKIQESIQNKKLRKEVFHADAGDLFIWHNNLLHGGEPILDRSKTRKSMVVHYFCDDVICYHEITQRPAYRY